MIRRVFNLTESSYMNPVEFNGIGKQVGGR